MTTQTANPVSIDAINKAFRKIYAGMDKTLVPELENEIHQLVPSENSEVYMVAGFNDEDNRISVSVYVSNPIDKSEVKDIHFDEIFFRWLLKANILKLSDVMECINYMERKGTDRYEIGFISASYNKKLEEYYFHFSIIKELQ